MSQTLPAVEDIRAAFAYDEASGELTWLVGQRAGHVAGCRSKDGYWLIRFDDRIHYAHRLVWAHQHGSWPDRQIDHKDGDKRNNRLNNLRLATNAENAQNVRAYRTNKSGYLGVSTIRGRYIAQIQVNGEHRVLGSSTDPAEAHELYLKAKAELHLFQPTPRMAHG